MNNWKEGDVVRWSLLRNDRFMPYHCKSQIAICTDGRFLDTFWTARSDRYSPSEVDCEFKYLGNINDYEECESYDLDYYEDDDTLDLSHPNNSGKFFVKINAEKSVDKIRAKLLYNKEVVERKIASLEYEITRIEDKLLNVTVETRI